MIVLFVYGTLKSDGALNPYLTGWEGESKDMVAEKIGEDTLECFTLHSLGAFPAMVPAGPRDYVRGELWRVGPELLQLIDMLEGAYIRIEATTKGGTHCHTYIWPRRCEGPRIGPVWHNSHPEWRRDR